MLRLLVAVLAGLPESVTRTEKLAVPLTVGVPEMPPVALLRERPVGNAPLVTR
jgi:hypothetical protein